MSDAPATQETYTHDEMKQVLARLMSEERLRQERQISLMRFALDECRAIAHRHRGCMSAKELREGMARVLRLTEPTLKSR